jgi:hypothetical protein
MLFQQNRKLQNRPAENKKTNPEIGLIAWFCWCGQSDSNARPLGS